MMKETTNEGSKITVTRIPENTIGIELGVWKGYSSEIFLQKAKYLHLVDSWSIEPFTGSSEFGTYDDYLKRYAKMVGSDKPEDFQKYYDDIYESVVERFKEKPIKIHRCKTNIFFEYFTEEVDWVYVDAGHDYKNCITDLRSSLKIIKKGGLIIGDDYHTKPGVTKAVNEFVKESGLIFDNFYGSQYEIKV